MIGGTVPPQRFERALVGANKTKTLSGEKKTPLLASPHPNAHFALDRAKDVIDDPLPPAQISRCAVNIVRVLSVNYCRKPTTQTNRPTPPIRVFLGLMGLNWVAPDTFFR